MGKTLRCLFALLLTLPVSAQVMQQAVIRAPAPSSGGSPVTLIQSQVITNTSGANPVTPFTSGNIAVVAMYAGSNTSTLGITDSLGNTYTALNPAFGLAVDADGVAVFCAPITTGGGTDTLAFTVNGSGSNVWGVLYEFHTTHGTCTTDVTTVKSNTLSATSCNSGPMTTTTANDLLVGACGTDATDTATITTGSGWSGGLNSALSGPTRVVLMSEYQVGTTAGSYTATSGTIPSEEQATVLVAIKP